MIALRERLRHDPAPLYASFLTLRDPAAAGILAGAGFTCLVIDCEHTRHSPETLERMVAACHQNAAWAVVRLPGLDRSWMAWALDSGADGLLLPMAETPDTVAQFLDLALYPPQGKRGYTGLSPATGFGKTRGADYIRRANADVLLGVQIETERALSALPTMLEQERLDLCFLGTGDLAVDLGIPGQYEDPHFQTALAGFFKTCSTAASPPVTGIFASAEPLLKGGLALGARFLVYGSDAHFMRQSALQAQEH